MLPEQLTEAYLGMEQGIHPVADNASDFLELLAYIVDHATDCNSEPVSCAAIGWAESRVEDLGLCSEQRVHAFYCIANAYATIAQITASGQFGPWLWESEPHGKQIYFLRKAIGERGFASARKSLRAQIFVNLANALNVVGRCVESREYWNVALNLLPDFGMALGNRGIGTTTFAQHLYDQGHAAIFMHRAYGDLTLAIQSRSVYEEARHDFAGYARAVERLLGEYLNEEIQFDEFTLGTTPEEQAYRRWCLRNTLFLNPLNDLEAHSIAATDVMHLPSMRVRAGEGPHFQGFFNQMKQEFASARYFVHEGLTAEGLHFADRDVYLVNTLDYPSYSLSGERVKVAYRLLYSLFDKIGYFINAYFRLGIPDHKVNFRTLWFERLKPENGLRLDIHESRNLPLQGLFWLSKDLFSKELSEVIEPSARALDTIRNHIEHKYFKVHTMFSASDRSVDDLFHDSLSYSMSKSDFDAKTMKLMKLARAGLMYLSMAVYAAEQALPSEQEGVVLSLPLGRFDDGWKH